MVDAGQVFPALACAQHCHALMTSASRIQILSTKAGGSALFRVDQKETVYKCARRRLPPS